MAENGTESIKPNTPEVEMMYSEEELKQLAHDYIKKHEEKKGRHSSIVFAPLALLEFKKEPNLASIKFLEKEFDRLNFGKKGKPADDVLDTHTTHEQTLLGDESFITPSETNPKHEHGDRKDGYMRD